MTVIRTSAVVAVFMAASISGAAIAEETNQYQTDGTPQTSDIAAGDGNDRSGPSNQGLFNSGTGNAGYERPTRSIFAKTAQLGISTSVMANASFHGRDQELVIR